MKPLNQAERNSAFLRFLLLFIITAGLIVLVVFFSMEAPFRESDQLRQSILSMQREREVSDSFNVVMREAMDELNKFDARQESPSATHQRVQFKVERMYRMLKALPDGEHSVYAMMVQNLNDFSTAKMHLSNMRAN